MNCVRNFAAFAGLSGILIACASPGEASTRAFPVACSVVGKTDAGLDEQVCREAMSVLSQTYPDVKFVLGTPSPGPSLEIIIHNATTSSVGLQLKWRGPSGEITEGSRVSVVMTDRKLDAGRRQSLYLRALTATPMPKQE